MVSNWHRSKASKAALTSSDRQPMNTIRYNPFASGKPFSSREANDLFDRAIVEVYGKEEWKRDSVTKIIDVALARFSETVSACFTITMLAEPNHDTTIGCIELTKPIYFNYSFCEHVAKRLMLLRKAGKLVKKLKPEMRAMRQGMKKAKFSQTGSAVIKKVE